MKKIIFYILFLMPTIAISQASETRKERNAKEVARIKKMQKESEEGAIIFNKQSAFNISLRTDGYSLGYEHGKFKTIKKTSIWWLTLGERKSTKEEKLSVTDNLGFQVGNPYIYGKQNNFYLFNLGFGQQRLLGAKGSKNGISVAAIYGGGLTVGMLKPYYLEVVSRNGYPETDIIKYDGVDARFLNSDSIVGSAPFGKGFNQIKFVPGVFAKGALRFDYAKFNDIMSALEIGLTAEYYTQKMPIMLLNKEKSLFITGYISLVFGSRK